MSGILLNILELSISMMPIIGLLLILSRLISKIYNSSLQYWIWLVVAMRLLLPFSPSAGWPVFFKLSSLEKLILESTAIGKSAPIIDSPINAVNLTDTSLSLVEIITVIYFTGLVIFLIYKFVLYIVFIKNIQKYYCSPSHKIADTALEIGQRIGFNVKNHGVSIYICRKIQSPMVVGIVKPVLLLPNETYDDTKLRMILSHEMIHMKRKDTLYKLLLLFVSAIHWFNPFVHLMVQRASRDIEISCDSRALHGADLEEKKLYSLMILDMASPTADVRFSLFRTGFGTGKESLEVRINNIFSSSKKKKGYVPLILVILITLFFGAVLQINYPAAYAQEAGDAVRMGGIGGEFDTSVPESPANREVMPGTINAYIGGETQTRGVGNKSSENQEEALKSNTVDKVAREMSAPAEIVVIDLNQLDSGKESDETMAAE